MERLLIAIPTYCREELLADCLRFVSELQSPTGFELSTLVVDNDSEGSARALCESLRDDFPHPLRYECEPRKGEAHARNRALDTAVGTGVAHLLFLDDDVFVPPDFLREMLARLKAKRADAVAGNLEFLDADGVRVRESPRRRKRRRTFLSTAQVLMTARLFRDLGLRFDPRFLRNTDADFFYRARLRGARLFHAPAARALEHDRGRAGAVTAQDLFAAAFDMSKGKIFIRRLRGGTARAAGYFLARALALALQLAANALLAPFSRRRRQGVLRVAGKLAGLAKGLFAHRIDNFEAGEGAPGGCAPPKPRPPA